MAKEFTVNYPKELNIEVFDWEADGNLGSLALSVGVQVVPALSTEALPPNSSKISDLIALLLDKENFQTPLPQPPPRPHLLCNKKSKVFVILIESFKMLHFLYSV